MMRQKEYLMYKMGLDMSNKKKKMKNCAKKLQICHQMNKYMIIGVPEVIGKTEWRRN